MKHLRKFNEHSTTSFEYDWDYINDKLHDEHGWGTSISLLHGEDFESSDYFTNSQDNDTTITEFNYYLNALQSGEIKDTE